MSTDSDQVHPRGFIRRVTFNADGYTLSDTHAYGQPEAQTSSSERPSPNNFIATATDTLNAQALYTRDDLGNVIAVTRCLPNESPCTDTTAGALTTRYTYDPHFQQVATVTDPLQHTTTYGYDAAGNLTTVTDPLQHQTTFAYNAIGQLTSTSDALHHIITFGYAGGDLTTVIDQLNRVTTRFTDAVGRVLAMTDPAGQTTRYVYNGNDQVELMTDPLKGQTFFAYFPDGQLASITDANQHTTNYTYDAMGRLASRTDPLQQTETFTYDLDGNPSQWTDREDQLTTRTYDALNRLHQIAYNDNSTITYTYDSRDRITLIDDSISGQISRSYDDFDRLLSETTPQGATGYTYDDAGRRATMTVTGQPQLTYAYDDANRLTGVTRDSLNVVVTYDDANRPTTLTVPNGVVTEYGYDDARQLTSLTYRTGATLLGDLTYQYDAAGQRVTVDGRWARTGLPQAVSSGTYDAANQALTWGAMHLSYDVNGNLASDGLTSYTWNARHELSDLSGQASATLGYDALRRRISKVSGSLNTQYVYDGPNVVQEKPNGALANTIGSTAADELWGRTGDQGTTFYLTDGLGSTIAETNMAGAVNAEYGYEPFGATQRTGGQSGNANQFTGRENDSPISTLYFYRARYFSPDMGRFISEDPVEFEGGVNLYAYANDSPQDLSDPFGTCSCSVTVRCRPVAISGAREAGTTHCYIVTKDEHGAVKTIIGGELKNRPEGVLKVWTLPGDPQPGNSATDPVFYQQEGASMCDKIDCLAGKAAVIDAMNLPYYFLGPNSNSTVVELMGLCGMSVTLPPSAIGRDTRLGPWRRIIRP